MTGNERAMLWEIGKRVAGPRHVVVLVADSGVLELVNSLTEAGLAESTGFMDQEGGEEVLRVCLTGKGWVRFRDGTG